MYDAYHLYKLTYFPYNNNDTQMLSNNIIIILH